MAWHDKPYIAPACHLFGLKTSPLVWLGWGTIEYHKRVEKMMRYHEISKLVPHSHNFPNKELYKIVYFLRSDTFQCNHVGDCWGSLVSNKPMHPKEINCKRMNEWLRESVGETCVPNCNLFRARAGATNKMNGSMHVVDRLDQRIGGWPGRN